MKVLGVIPARYNATRFPGKLLKCLDNKFILQHTWNRAKESKRLTDLYIATDNEKIWNVGKHFGAKMFQTHKCHSGTERIIEVISYLRDFDIIINIQGDEPFINPKDIDRLVAVMINNEEVVMATIVTDITTYELYDPNIVKAYVKDGFAVDFSRHAIWKDKDQIYKHIGIYAYRKDFLLNYYKMPKEPHEMVEKLEQLRAIENGFNIKVIKTKHFTIGIDTVEDLEKAKKYLKGGKR